MDADQFEIKRAERRQARLRLAVCAASNGGKTWTSLLLAFGIVEELLARNVLRGTLEGKVGLIDTERKSAQLFSHLAPFDTIDLGPPYGVDRYVAAMQQFERAGYAVMIVDSISHAWAGAGGVLSLLDRFDTKDRFNAFGTTLKPAQDEFVDAMLRSPCHIIATMRSKTAWVLEDKENRSGFVTKAPRRIGMAPIQRPGIEYEFTTLLDLDTNTHVASVVKNRCSVFDNWQPRIITREHGRQLAAWLLEGAPEPAEPLGGTPLERAQAVTEAAIRMCEKQETIPDLARVFLDAQRTLRSFAPAVPIEEVEPLLQKVIAAKDVRKAQLGAPVPGAGQLIDLAAAVALEQLLQDVGIPLADCYTQFGVMRLALIPAAKLPEVNDWISKKADERAAQADATASGMTGLAAMKDDIPWEGAAKSA